MEPITNHLQSSWSKKTSRHSRLRTRVWSRYWIVAPATIICFSLGVFAQEANSGGAQEGSTRRAQDTDITPAAASAGSTDRTPQAGYVFVPESSKEQGSGFAHTTYVLRSTNGSKPAALAGESGEVA